MNIKGIGVLQIIGLPFVLIGVLRLREGETLNGATWLLVGISMLTYRHPVATDGSIKWHARSIIGYAAMVGAVALMIVSIAT
ncbi:MAG: hypothetical protein JXJ20_14160 [Anaerolineae bacterium]|jgi:hypothetical protein|nr:hypothetical protein [Anaerolineae bacterium]